MFGLIVKIFVILVILVGIVMIYDARIITKNFFGFGDQNEASSGLKIFGFLMAIIGAIILYFSF